MTVVGILVWFSNYAALNGNVIKSNLARSGGGVSIWNSDALLTNNAVVDNVATSSGSGVSIRASSPRLVHTTLARNAGGDGSGIYAAGSAFLINTILVSQTVGISVTSGYTATLDGVLWFGNQTNTVGAGTSNVTNGFTGNPAFAADGYHVASGSAAIDRGVNAGVTTDIDGQTRPYGAASDLGADEYAPGQTSTAYSQAAARLINGRQIDYHPGQHRH